MFLKIAAQTFEAEDFLNIFLRFLGFWGSFYYKNFSYIYKNSVYPQPATSTKLNCCISVIKQILRPIKSLLKILPATDLSRNICWFNTSETSNHLSWSFTFFKFTTRCSTHNRQHFFSVNPTMSCKRDHTTKTFINNSFTLRSKFQMTKNIT